MVRLTDTTLRDAHQSLLATRLRTRDMLPACDKLDRVGFHSLEVWGGATFDVCLRYLNENPWERLKMLRSALPRSRLQMLLRGQNLVGYRHYADDIVERFVARAARLGIDIFRVFDALNDVRNMELAIRVAKREGKEVQGAVCYTLSPVHTVESYVQTFRRLAELGCDSLCIKDMAGLITPAAAKELIRAVKKEVGLPLCLHSHCTAGLAPMSYLAAAEAGCDILDTAISPLSGGSSQPAAEAVVAALQGTPADTGLDLSLLNELREYFARIREKYGALIDPVSERVDTSVLVYQIPGGMLSNLISQLKEQNAMDKFAEVLRETPRVRAELGYPPLVTPTSQLVGTQAVFNVLCGERYRVVSNEVKDYLKGRYGRTPAPVDERIRKKVIGDEEPIAGRPADLLPPEWPAVVEEGRKLGVTDEEELLMLALFPSVAKSFLRGELKEEPLPPQGARGEALRPPGWAAPRREESSGCALEGGGAGEERGGGEGASDPILTEQVLSARALSGHRQYLVRVGERVFEVSVEDAGARPRAGPAVWFPFGISRSQNRREGSRSTLPTSRPRSGPTARRLGLSPTRPLDSTPTPSPPQRPGAPQISHHPAITSAGATTAPEKSITAPMQGLLTRVLCSVGESVRAGQCVAVLEAMKMENEIQAPTAGVVKEIRVKPGTQVSAGETIILLE
ncbi:MAG: pyruvate/oxaloacetate carboxyltransferase [Thermoplasmata archaeon]